MKLNFSQLSEPLQKPRGQVGTRGHSVLARVSVSPIVSPVQAESGDKPGTAFSSTFDLSPLVPIAPAEVGTLKPSIGAVSPMSPLVPIKNGRNGFDGGILAANRTPADERLEKVIAKLASAPDLRYAMETHLDADLDAVILSLAIRGKAACELRIPKSRYDAFVLIELIEQHTTREVFQ